MHHHFIYYSANHFKKKKYLALCIILIYNMLWKGIRKQTENYQPISLIIYILKFKKIIRNKIDEQPEKVNCPHSFRHRFWKKRLCLTELIDYYDIPNSVTHEKKFRCWWFNVIIKFFRIKPRSWALLSWLKEFLINRQ